MRDATSDNQAEPAGKNRNLAQEEATPGSKGYPEPGSGHDESKTTTVNDGPPIEKTDGVPGAFGEVEIDRQP